ncbi:anillin-like isoform X2 [Trichoplusia ni]|uniref:Anillin-like isoform X2 n=1 Tax=Trichoplusia ni TaxID=7111 RepID=A0A7E5VJ12_TRINI|nr:anillin-like isoform X2 [Trichoplusia ni]
MDPFTQRMLERARARQEKIDQKLANSGQTVPKRKPLSENIAVVKSENSPVKSPSKMARESITSPRRQSKDCTKSETPTKAVAKRSSMKSDVASPQRRNDVIVTKKEFKSPKRGSINRRNSDVSVEINISHRNDIQIEVQVEERDAPICVVYDSQAQSGNTVVIKEITEDTPSIMEKAVGDAAESKSDRPALRHNIKSRLDRLGNLYSDTPTLSSPIHRTELQFSAATPPTEQQQQQQQQQQQKPRQQPGKKFGRLAALADQINNWEDDLSHHTYQPDSNKTASKSEAKQDKDASTLDVSIHSFKDINKVLDSAKSRPKETKKFDSHTFTKSSMNECQRLNRQIVAELEGEGYRRVSAGQSRLVYEFTTKTGDPARQEPKCASTTPSAASAPNMATMVAPSPANPAVTKKPSIKKYKAPTPPRNIITEDDCESEKDKENAVQLDDNGVSDDCKQTKPEPADDKPAPEKGSPLVKKLAPKINGSVDRSSVLSKAAMFETGSPKAKDPAEMSLRERKALFEKNKGAAIVPKAPFGLAPSVKTLLGENKGDKKTLAQKTTPTKTSNSSLANSRTNSKDEIPDDNISQSSLGGGIKGKLAALFSKEQTISETTIANKFKQEREKEMEMLQNRFHYKPKQQKPENPNDSDDESSEHDPSEKAPLMGSTTSLTLTKKPEIISNIPKVTFEEKTRSEQALHDKEKEAEKEDRVIGAQPVKRRSSQDSPVVLSVLDDVKRIKVNNSKKDPQTNGAVLQQPTSLYPHLSDIETDTSHTQEEYSDCGGSSSEDVQESVNDKMNKSDNWAETSFGREVMNVVKKNNTSYKKAVRESDSDSSGLDSELDDILDEAINEQVEGPTPPKVNKERSAFKSPLKVQVTPAGKHDRGAELVHSVSFYRRMQNASSTPSTPLRVVRHASPERSPPPTPDEPAASVTTVRERIKELQNEIAKQQTIISQASQALNLCAATIEFSGSTEQAEGERLLLLATHRRQACLHELQRLQVEGAGPAATAGMATLHLTALSVPLKRDYIRQLNADGAVGHHAVCLIKCRDRVLATSMQQTQPTATVLQFPDDIRMLGLASDFKVTVEVYLLQASKEVLSHEVKYHITSKKSSSKLLTPKSKVSELKAPRVQSPAGPLAVRTPQFSLHGYCIFALQQATRKSFTLNKVPCGSPLEGSVSVNISARVQVSAPAPHAAFLTAFDDVSGLGAWHRRWFRLQPPTLAYWKYPDDVQRKMPIGDIDLSSVISERASKAPRDLCARPNTILLESMVPAGLVVPDCGSLVYVRGANGSLVRRHLLAADTPRDRDLWIDTLNKALEYVRCCGTDED